ncbi:MAG: heavy metal translocating P-type ATPase, partial [Planctomycetota bacterium]
MTSMIDVVFLLLVGRWIQQKYQRAAQERLTAQFCLTPSFAQRIQAETGKVTDVPLEALRVGDQVQVAPGRIVPVDGRIVVGQSELDRSLLTGESDPIRCGVGEWVEAG